MFALAGGHCERESWGRRHEGARFDRVDGDMRVNVTCLAKDEHTSTAAIEHATSA